MAIWHTISERFLVGILIAALTLSGLSLTGCGRQGDIFGRVHGKVTFQGTALCEGLVKFKDPQKGIYMTAKLGPDGSYAVEMAQGSGLPVGTYLVSVGPPHYLIPLGREAAPSPTPETFPDIPEKYRRCETSGLTVTVKEGDNRFDIDM